MSVSCRHAHRAPMLRQQQLLHPICLCIYIYIGQRTSLRRRFQNAQGSRRRESTARGRETRSEARSRVDSVCRVPTVWAIHCVRLPSYSELRAQFRLKLKCDRVVPCASCTRRGCESICPNGEIQPSTTSTHPDPHMLDHRSTGPWARQDAFSRYGATAREDSRDEWTHPRA